MSSQPTDPGRPGGRSALATVGKFLVDHVVLVLAALFAGGILVLQWHRSQLLERLIESAALQEAADYSEILTAFRTLYTSEVVRAAEKHLEVTHDYEKRPNAIPLPATLSLRIGRLLEEGGGVQTRLYSPYPFSDRGGLQDDFQKAAWQALTEDPKKPFYRWLESSGEPTLRYAVADRMRPECIDCHNKPGAPKTGWKVGDVRGVLEVEVPVKRTVAQAQANIRESTLLMVGLAGVGLAGLGLVVVRLRRHASDSAILVEKRTAELAEANAQLQQQNAELQERTSQREQAAAALVRQTEELRSQQLAALNIAADAEEARRAADEARRRAEHNEQALAAANAELQRTQQTLADMAAQLALPARELDPERMTFRINDFSLTDMMSCGAVIRGMRSRCADPTAFAGELVRFLYEHMIDESGQPTCPLVRFYETRRFGELDAQRRAFAAALWDGVAAQTRCLTLVASAGDHPEWNDWRQSAGHQAIPLASPEAVERLPMIAQLIRQLGFDVAGVVHADRGLLIERNQTSVFHVAEAKGSPYIPAQDGFVIPHGIRSVLGFGDVLPDGRLFAVILFAKAPIPRDVARLFGHLSLSTRMALLSYLDAADRTRAQIASLDRLLQNHEEIVAAQERTLQTTMQELRRSNTELEQFAYIASHDLQEPLRKVRTFSDMLAGRVGAALDQEGRLYLERMQNAAQRMQGLISDLLTFARVTTKGRPFQSVDLGETARQVVSDLEVLLRSSGGRVEIGDLPTLAADATQMRQLLQNLIGNALKFHRPNEPPFVRVQSRLLQPSGAFRPDGEEVSWWEIAVEDHGIGFEEKHLERIFMPFQRLHGRGEYEGTGMGLAICRKIVERHGGVITARSTPGQGSTFLVRLPSRQPGGTSS